MKVMGIGDDGQPTMVELPKGDSTSRENFIVTLFEMLSYNANLWVWARQFGDQQPYKVAADNALENILTLLYEVISRISKEAQSEHDKNEVTGFLKSLKE